MSSTDEFLKKILNAELDGQGREERIYSELEDWVNMVKMDCTMFFRELTKHILKEPFFHFPLPSPTCHKEQMSE